MIQNCRLSIVSIMRGLFFIVDDINNKYMYRALYVYLIDILKLKIHIEESRMNGWTWCSSFTADPLVTRRCPILTVAFDPFSYEHTLWRHFNNKKKGDWRKWEAKRCLWPSFNPEWWLLIRFKKHKCLARVSDMVQLKVTVSVL